MWIKIKDHLPAEGQQIIAFSPDNGTDYPVSIGFWVSYENGLCDAPDGVVARKFAFTHWQPIPDAPPKATEQGAVADLPAADGGLAKIETALGVYKEYLLLYENTSFKPTFFGYCQQQLTALAGR